MIAAALTRSRAAREPLRRAGACARRLVRASALASALAALTSLAACQRTVDMASVHGPTWVATTIPYTGVREATRQFPDYNIIDARILAAAPDEPGPASHAKRGASR